MTSARRYTTVQSALVPPSSLAWRYHLTILLDRDCSWNPMLVNPDQEGRGADVGRWPLDRRCTLTTGSGNAPRLFFGFTTTTATPCMRLLLL